MFKKTFVGVFLAVFALFAASIDGKWKAEQKMERNGNEFTITTTLDLKADGANLTGSVTTGFGERQRTSEVQNGKMEGNKVTFTTKQQMRDQEFEVKWNGSVEGDELKLTRTFGEGRTMDIVAKRQ